MKQEPNKTILRGVLLPPNSIVSFHSLFTKHKDKQTFRQIDYDFLTINKEEFENLIQQCQSQNFKANEFGRIFEW